MLINTLMKDQYQGYASHVIIIQQLDSLVNITVNQLSMKVKRMKTVLFIYHARDIATIYINTMINKLAVCYRNMSTGNTSVDWKYNLDQTRQRNPDVVYIVLHEQFCCYKRQYKLFVKRMKRMYCKLARS